MSKKIVQLNEEIIKGQIKELVRGSVEEALIEMYLAGVSVRRVEDITEALWGSKVSPATISELNKKAYVHAQPPLAGRTVSIRLCGRHLPAPQLGRRVRKCFCFGGNRRK